MIAADTSIAVAAYASWHEDHLAAAGVLRDGPRLVAHCAFETYSVLTRLPGFARAPGDLVREFLAANFADAWLALEPDAASQLLTRIAQAGIGGGAVYDALIAGTAALHGATLTTLDRRATATYERIGAAWELIAAQ